MWTIPDSPFKIKTYNDPVEQVVTLKNNLWCLSAVSPYLPSTGNSIILGLHIGENIKYQRKKKKGENNKSARHHS